MRESSIKGKRASIPARIACGLKLKSEAKMTLRRSDPVLRNRRPTDLLHIKRLDR
jgi:hypothetical protein